MAKCFRWDNLPDCRIRSCFLYFSLVPEDFTLLKNNLIDLINWLFTAQTASTEFVDHKSKWNGDWGRGRVVEA